MKISNTKLASNNFIKALIYGASGNGKTTLAKTIADYRPVILNAEGGLMSLAGSDIDVIDVATDDSGKLVPITDRAARVKAAYVYLNSDEARAKYNTVFIDSLTEIGQIVHAMVAKEFPERKDALVLWGEYNSKMRDLIKAFRDLPGYHVVFTCLSKVEKDDSGKRYAAFDLQGGIAEKLPGFFDIVSYLRVNQEGERELICQPQDAITAKDRSSKLNKIEPANLGSLFDKILNGGSQC